MTQYADRMTQFLEDFARDNAHLATFFEDNIRRELANRGWFIAGSLYPSQYAPLAEALKQNHRQDNVEEFLMMHVRGLVPKIESNATQRWPDRVQILKDAFDAHSAGKYTLSVPVLLAQADGISADLLDAFLFTNHHGHKVDTAAANVIKNHCQQRPLAESFLGLLLEVSGLRVDTDKRDKQKASGVAVCPLNRHGVLHGLDRDYGTEANSLRAISLIGFLDWVASVLTGQTDDTPQQSLGDND